jgi:hypothetical protein
MELVSKPTWACILAYRPDIITSLCLSLSCHNSNEFCELISARRVDGFVGEVMVGEGEIGEMLA